ncbi:MAG: tetratricopeptide repeat protein, partial [Candidatus Thorarchaeota archaeon]
EYHTKSLEIRKNQDVKPDIALSLVNMGSIEQRKENLDQAEDLYQQGLAIYEAIGNEIYIAITTFHLVILEIEKNQIRRASEFLEKLEKLSSNTNNPSINQRFRIAKALILKSSNSAREKLDAQEILNEVVNEEIMDHSLTVLAMIHLCELLLFELKLSDDDKLLSRIIELTERLIEIGREQGSFTLLAKANILQSKLALVEGDVEKARIHLAQAHITAQEKGLNLLARKIAHERDMLQTQLEKWEKVIKKNPPKQEMADLANLDEFLERMIRKTVSVLSKEEKQFIDDEAIKKKYSLNYVDLLENKEKSEKSEFRIGIAQFGLSSKGDILSEFYRELGTGLLGIREDKLEFVISKFTSLITSAHNEGVNVLLFPEMTIDMNYPEMVEEVKSLAKEYEMYIIPGSYHTNEKQNLCRVISPEGVIWEQEKHIPAIIHLKGERFTEGINVSDYPRRVVICNTEYGRMAITICRDFLDMDLRVELKNFEPPIDLIFNPAFTPVTVDFKAAHFDARRSIYAYCCFANVAEFGDSMIHSPERERIERLIPKGEEGIIYKDIDLFQLRSERKKWESIQKKQRSFIQSTRL